MKNSRASMNSSSGSFAKSTGSDSDSDDDTVNTYNTFNMATSRSTLPPLKSVEKRTRGRVSGIKGVRTTMDMNSIHLLSLLKTKKERLVLMEQIAMIKDDVSAYIAPEKSIVLKNEFGTTEWKERLKGLDERQRSQSRWIQRFEKRMKHLEIIDPKPTKEQLRSERIEKSGWKNCPMKLPTRIAPVEAESMDEMALNTDYNENSDRQLFCLVCWGIVEPVGALCCSHCFVVAHSSCIPVLSREDDALGPGTFSCPFCVDEMAAYNNLLHTRYQLKQKEHRKIVAVLRLQSWVRRCCKRMWYLRLSSAIKTVQRTIRKRIYHSRLSKAIREAPRPIRLRFHSLMLYCSRSDEVAAVAHKELLVAPRVLHAEVGSMPAGLYEEKFGWNASPKRLPNDSEIVKVLKARHKSAPSYAEQPPPKSARYAPGEYFLVLTAHEAVNNEFTFPVGFNVSNREKRKPDESATKAVRQLYRCDIPMNVLETSTEHLHDGSEIVTVVHLGIASGREYLLIPRTNAMVDIAWSAVRVREWPKCDILGQACINVQSLQGKKKCSMFHSQLCTDSSIWHVPMVGEESSKINIVPPSSSSRPRRPLPEDSRLGVVGGLTWTFLAHTDESENQSGYCMLHTGPSLQTNKKKFWCLLLDRVFYTFHGSSSRPKNVLEIKNCTVSPIAGQEGMVRIKGPGETLFVGIDGARDSKGWTRKLCSQCSHV